MRVEIGSLLEILIFLLHFPVGFRFSEFRGFDNQNFATISLINSWLKAMYWIVTWQRKGTNKKISQRVKEQIKIYQSFRWESNL